MIKTPLKPMKPIQNSHLTKTKISTFRSHMQDLQEVTHDLHYENYRATRLADGSDSDGPGNSSFFFYKCKNTSRFGQTTCSCTKIRYRYQVTRKGG